MSAVACKGNGWRLLVLAFTALGGCNDRVSLGSWGPGLTDGGGAAGASSTAGSSGVAGIAGSTGVAGSAGAGGEGEIHACRAAGTPLPLNRPGSALGVTIPYTDWTWPSPMDSMEWDLQVESEIREDGYFWTHQFRFAGEARGFLGLQARGGYQADPPFGPIVTADMVTFWISSEPLRAALGDVAYPDARTYLQEEDEGEQWMTIHARYEWTPCRTYRLRVGRASSEPSGDIWYGAWILDTNSGVETFVGRILVPAAWGQLQPSSSMWSNRIGYAPLTSCSSAEPASAFYGTPTAEGGTVRPLSFVNRFDELRCPTSRFTEFADGVRHELGVQP